jgi:hypothetical protein
MLKLRCEVELDVISRRSDALAKLLRFGEDMMANRRIKDFRRCSGILVIVVDMVKRDVDLILCCAWCSNYHYPKYEYLEQSDRC